MLKVDSLFTHISTIFYLLISMLSFELSLFAIYDLEERSQEFVLEIKKIEIPNHPHSFNPSIVRWRGALLMSFREIPFPYVQTSLMILGKV